MIKALIVAGEASGDIYGSALAVELNSRIPDLKLFGMGGDRMEEAGVDLLFHHTKVSVVGVFEVFSKLQKLRQAYALLTDWIRENSPRFAILIDFPDFNFRLVQFLKKRGIRVFYFISPQIWAWRKGRIHFLKKHIDLMVSILPFEKDLYEKEGIPMTYVGHPLVEIVEKEVTLQPAFAKTEKPLLGLMPGSRDTEVERHLPIMLKTAAVLRNRMDLDVMLIQAPGLQSPSVALPSYVQQITTDRYASMKVCDFMIVASGTSTLEAAILKVPFVIVYKVGPVSWWLGKFLVRVPYYGLVNWIAEKKVVPEFIQNEMQPGLLADQAARYLTDRLARESMRSDLTEIVKKLGPPGAIQRAADAILALV